MKLMLLVLIANIAFGHECAELMLKIVDPLRVKRITLSKSLNNESYSYLQTYFKGDEAATLPLPINHTSYHPKELARELFGSAKEMLKTLNINPLLTKKRWKMYLDSDYIKARWMVRGDGTIISWSLKETENIYQASSKRIAKLLDITLKEAQNRGNTKIMAIPGAHQDMLSLLSRNSETKHPVIAWGYITFEDGKYTIGQDSYYEKGQDQLFDILKYLGYYLKSTN